MNSLRFNFLVTALSITAGVLQASGESGQLREMATDRPDATESPFTIDPGHVQVEADFFSITRNRLDGVHTRETSVGTTNVRWGVSDRTELGIFVAPWIRQTEQPRFAGREARSGVGDIVLRGKANFWGNDGADSAGGLIVDLKLPTAADGLGNGSVEGAVILPYSRKLPAGWELGAMVELDLRRNESDSGYIPVLVTTATVSHDLTTKIGVYFELTSATGEGSHLATFDTGLTFAVNDNFQLDCGANVGISRRADDLQIFAGLARRF